VRVFINGYPLESFAIWYGNTLKVIEEYPDKNNRPNWVKKLIDAVEAYEKEHFSLYRLNKEDNAKCKTPNP